jgi:hypothetical protein
VCGWVSAAILGFGVLSAAGCGAQPSAGDLWGRPAQSGARSAHAIVTAVGGGGGGSFQGDGTVVFKPRLAMSLHLQTRLGPMPGELDLLESGGVTYQRTAAGQRWTRSSGAAPDPMGTGATDPRLVGEDTVRGAPAWHLRATRAGTPIQLWVRIRDGYPVKAVTGSGGGTVFTFVFDQFNTGAAVAAPQEPDVMPAPLSLHGRVGDALALNEATIAVLSCDDDAAPDGDSLPARPGNRFVVVEVSVENTGGDDLSTFLDWRVTDSGGDTWTQALGVRAPEFQGGELPPGGSSHGYLTYEVSATAAQLVLIVKLDRDEASFSLS